LPNDTPLAFSPNTPYLSATMTRRALIFTLSGTAAGVAIAYGFRQFGQM